MSAESRKRMLRGTLLLIIVGTLPFYCIGFFLWGNAPDPNAPIQTLTQEPSNTPIGGDATATDSAISSPTALVTATLIRTLPPTPTSGGGIIIQPTRFLSPTPFPTATFTLIPPTNTSMPPTATWTQVVRPTDTPIPFPTETFTAIVLPTDTTVPPTVTETPIQLPSETPTQTATVGGG